ncbi:hypothetical protein BLOT_011011 [Blomia tropicalis]|nr:hypothetical protein BLOT_011011 [Blomia tropicalis]
MENNKSNWDCEPQAISGDFGGPNNSAFEIPKASTSFDPMAFGTSPSNTIQAKHMRANHVNFSMLRFVLINLYYIIRLINADQTTNKNGTATSQPNLIICWENHIDAFVVLDNGHIWTILAGWAWRMVINPIQQDQLIMYDGKTKRLNQIWTDLPEGFDFVFTMPRLTPEQETRVDSVIGKTIFTKQPNYYAYHNYEKWRKHSTIHWDSACFANNRFVITMHNTSLVLTAKQSYMPDGIKAMIGGQVCDFDSVDYPEKLGVFEVNSKNVKKINWLNLRQMIPLDGSAYDLHNLKGGLLYLALFDNGVEDGYQYCIIFVTVVGMGPCKLYAINDAFNCSTKLISLKENSWIQKLYNDFQIPLNKVLYLVIGLSIGALDKSNPNDKVKVPDNASKKSDQPKPNATANQTHPKQVQDENSDIVQQNFVRTNEGTVVGQAQETQQHPMQQQQQQPQEGWPGIEELCNIPNDNVPLQSSQSQWPQLGQSIESIIRERTNSERPNRGRGSNWLGGKRQNVRRPYRGHSRGRRPVWNPNDPYHRQRQFAKKYITQTDQYTKYHVPLPKPEPNPENGETKPIPLDIYFPNTRKIIHKCRVMFKFVDKKVTYIKIEFRFHDAPQFDRPKYYEYIELMRPIVPLLGNPVPNERGHKFDDGDKRNLRYVKEFPISDIIFISTLFNRSIGYWFYSFCINSGLRIVIMGLLYPWIKEAIPMEQVVAPEHLNPNICGENQTYLIGSGQMSNPIFTMEKKYELRRYIYQWVYQFTELYWDSLSREQCTDSMRRELENFKSVIMVKYESYGRIEPPKWDDLLSEPIDTTIHHTQEEHRQVRPVFGFSNIDGKYFLYQSRNDTWKMLNNIQFIGAKMEDIQPSPNRRLVFAFEVNVSSGVHIPIGDVHFWRIAYLGQYNSLTIYYYNKPFYVHIQCRFAIDLYRLVVSFENWIGFDIKYIDNNRSFIGKRLAPIKETFEHIFSRIFPGCYVPEFRTFHQRFSILPSN